MTHTEKKMDLVYKNGKMVVVTMDIFLKIKHGDGEFILIHMVAYIKENLKMIKRKVMENINTKMEFYIMVIGMMIYNMVLDMKFGLILLIILGNIIMEKKMV